jgi:hypothetical protein
MMDSLVYPGRGREERESSVRFGLRYLAEMHTASSGGNYPNMYQAYEPQ